MGNEQPGLNVGLRRGAMLAGLARAWTRCPNLRLGQFLAALAQHRGIDLFYMEDAELLGALDRIAANGPGEIANILGPREA